MNRAIAWFAENHVAANLLMMLLVVGGLLSIPTIKQEIMPELSLDVVTVRVVYPGAAPIEIEEGICIRIEEELQGLQGVKRISSTAAEGRLPRQRRAGGRRGRPPPPRRDPQPRRRDRQLPRGGGEARDRPGRRPLPGAGRRGLGRRGRGDPQAPGPAGARRDRRPAGDHRRRAGGHASLRGRDRGLGGRASAARPDLRPRGARGAPILAGSARRLREDRRR